MKGLLRQHEVCERLGIHVTTWIRWRKSGAVPEPAHSPGAKRWRESDIEALAQGEARPAGEGRRYFGAAHRAAARVRHVGNSAETNG